MPKRSMQRVNVQEKGQVLVVVGLVMVVLVAMVGLAVDSGYIYLRYSALNRAVDSAALAASGEFNDNSTHDQNLRDTRIRSAAAQMLSLNTITPDATAGFSDPVLGTPGFSVETCNSTPGDTTLCALGSNGTPQKIVRVTVQIQVPTFFMGVLGFRSVPIKISSLSTKAAVDAMLVLDTSASMADESSGFGDPPDTKACNLGSHTYCEPMWSVIQAAQQFVGKMYSGYDRVGLVTFNQTATEVTGLTTDLASVDTALYNLQVYEGAHSHVSDGTTGTECIYYRDYKNVPPTDPDSDGDLNMRDNDADNDGDISYPDFYQTTGPAYYWDYNHRNLDAIPAHASNPDDPNKHYDSSILGPCRLFNVGVDQPDGTVKTFVGWDCPSYFGSGAGSMDPSSCGTTNLHDSILMAGDELTNNGSQTSVWAMVLLSDGRATAGYWPTNATRGGTAVSGPICPSSTWIYANCRDTAPQIRHCLDQSDYNAIGDSGEYSLCMNPKFPATAGGTLIGSSSDDPTNYDVDDAARDAFDLVGSNNTYIFTIGLGGNLHIPPLLDGSEAGETLLNYGASVGHGAYLPAASSSDLASIFTQIAGLITSRINK